MEGWEAGRKYCRGRTHFLLLFVCVCLRVLSELTVLLLRLVATESGTVSPVVPRGTQSVGLGSW